MTRLVVIIWFDGATVSSLVRVLWPCESLSQDFLWHHLEIVKTAKKESRRYFFDPTDKDMT